MLDVYESDSTTCVVRICVNVGLDCLEVSQDEASASKENRTDAEEKGAMTVRRLASERSLSGFFREFESSFARFVSSAMVLVVREKKRGDVIMEMSQERYKKRYSV